MSRPCSWSRSDSACRGELRRVGTPSAVAYAEPMREFPPSLRPYVRTTWAPTVAPGDPPCGSKFGGTAWLPEGTSHPRCGNCERPLPLIAQLEVASLPEAARFGGDGMLQLFYCLSTDPLCENDTAAWAPHASSVVARRIDLSQPGARSNADAQVLDAKAIVGWTSHTDVPHVEELESLGAEAEEDIMEADDDEEGSLRPRSGEKLWGWPLWIQGVEYPSCRICDTSMQLVLQIDSDGLVDVMWGDVGCAHLTQCPHHPGELAFGWACG